MAQRNAIDVRTARVTKTGRFPAAPPSESFTPDRDFYTVSSMNDILVLAGAKAPQDGKVLAMVPIGKHDTAHVMLGATQYQLV